MIHHRAFVHLLAHVDREGVRLGAGTKVWQLASITRGTVMGDDCSVSPSAMPDGSIYGDRVIVSAGVACGAGFEVGNDVFLGPNCCLGNDMWPTAHKDGYDDERLRNGTHFAVIVDDGATIGALAMIFARRARRQGRDCRRRGGCGPGRARRLSVAGQWISVAGTGRKKRKAHEMGYGMNSTEKTLRHIKHVQDLLGEFAAEMIRRGAVHDASKFTPEEAGPARDTVSEPLRCTRLFLLKKRENPTPRRGERYRLDSHFGLHGLWLI